MLSGCTLGHLSGLPLASRSCSRSCSRSVALLPLPVITLRRCCGCLHELTPLRCVLCLHSGRQRPSGSGKEAQLPGWNWCFMIVLAH